MPIYNISLRADHDLVEIARYGAEKFGIDQSYAYKTSLYDSFETLTEFPEMGVKTKGFKENIRKHEHQSHFIFYKITDDGILILRVLGIKMKSKKHLEQ